MVDTYVSGAYEVIREGSSPFSDTISVIMELLWIINNTVIHYI